MRAQRSISGRQRAQDKRLEDRSDARERNTFILRLAWTLLAMAMAFVAHARLRRRRSRYLTVGLAAIGFATAQAVVVSVDYITDYIDIAKAGPAVLSAAGIAMSWRRWSRFSATWPSASPPAASSAGSARCARIRSPPSTASARLRTRSGGRLRQVRAATQSRHDAVRRVRSCVTSMSTGPRSAQALLGLAAGG